MSKTLTASSQRDLTPLFNSILSSPQQKALMKAKVISRILLNRGRKSSKSVVRIEKAIEYDWSYRAGDHVSKEMRIQNWLYSSDLWVKPSFFHITTMWLRFIWELSWDAHVGDLGLEKCCGLITWQLKWQDVLGQPVVTIVLVLKVFILDFFAYFSFLF